VAAQQAVVDGAVQQVEGDFEVRLGGDLAAVTGPDEELAGRVAPGLDEVAAVKLGKIAVRLRFCDETGHDAGVGLAVQLSNPRAEPGQEVAAQAPGVALAGWRRGCPFGGERVER
jgi:hypothetical protein